MSNQNDNGNGILLEQIIHQNQVLIENIGDMREKVDLIPKIAEDVESLKVQVETITSALKETNEQVNNHEVRITDLEQQAA